MDDICYIDKPRLFSITQAARIAGLDPCAVRKEFFKGRNVLYNREEHYLTFEDFDAEYVRTYGKKSKNGNVVLYDDGYLLTELFLFELAVRHDISNEYVDFITMELAIAQGMENGTDMLDELEKLETEKEKWIIGKAGIPNKKGRAGR